MSTIYREEAHRIPAIIDQGTVYRNPHPNHHPLDASASSLCWSPSFGGLLCAFRVGPAKLSPDGSLRLRASGDGGRTWRQLASPLSQLDGDELNHAGFHLGSDGRTTVLAGCRMSIPAPGSPEWTAYESGIRDADTVIVRGEDGRWDDVLVGDWRRHPDEWAIPCGPPLPLGAGDWLLPMESHARSDREGWLRAYHAFTIRSHDGGRTWGEPSPAINGPGGAEAYYDQRMTLVAGGRLLTIAWVHDVVVDRTLTALAGFSDDGGRAWSPPFDTGLPGGPVNPCTLRDGRVLAVYSRRTATPGILAVLSEDGGRTWTAERQLAIWDGTARRVDGRLLAAARAGGDQAPLWDTMWSWTFGSPTPVQVPDGTVHVAFHAAGLDGVREVRWVRLAVE
jgi:hypothetical protein